jgi:transposase
VSEQKLEVQIEPVEDLPILLAKLERMRIRELVDRHFKTHGNWQGCNLGTLVVVWLTYILSEGDHRLSEVQEWVAARINTLGLCLQTSVRAEDFSDDRLAIVLNLLGQDRDWQDFEGDMTKDLLRVYDLKSRLVRLDSTSGSGYWRVTENGLFQFGHSKDHRPDLPQFKVMLATLDPLGLTVGIQVVSGEKADDPLYIPAIEQVRKNTGRSGLFYVGDSKMMSLETRIELVANGDNYLGPFSKVQMPDEALLKLLAPVIQGEQTLEEIERNGEIIAIGFETSVVLTGQYDKTEIKWTERRLVVRSLQHAKAAAKALQTRLAQAEEELSALNKRGRGREHFRDTESLERAARAVLEKHKVSGCFQLKFHEEVKQRELRAYKDRPAETRIEHEVSLSFERDETAIENVTRLFGWRVYGTNQPATDFSLTQAVLAYRNEYLVERNFGRLKGKSLALTPMYLQDDQRATGLIRLLSIGLRALTLLEHVARQNLKKNGQKLAGVYAGNPKRETATPRAETLLRVFKNIYLTAIHIAGKTHHHITPLTPTQKRILEICDLPPSIYDELPDNNLLFST